MDKIILKLVRKWCQLPVCANIKHLSIPLSKLDINFKSAKMLYNQCKLSTRRILRQSKNPETQKLYTFRSFRHINHDCLIHSVSTESQNQVLSNKQFNSRVDRKFNRSVFSHTWSKFINLNEQQLLLCHVLKVCRVKIINMWQALAKQLPSNIFNFWFYVYLTNPIFVVERLQKTINAFFAAICKHNFVCCQIVKNAWIDRLRDMILC